MLYPLLLTHTDTLSHVSSLQVSEIKKFAPFSDSKSDKQGLNFILNTAIIGFDISLSMLIRWTGEQNWFQSGNTLLV